MSKRPTRRKLDVRCLCGLWGLLVYTGKVVEGKDLCKFFCGCKNPQANLIDPYHGEY